MPYEYCYENEIYIKLIQILSIYSFVIWGPNFKNYDQPKEIYSKKIIKLHFHQSSDLCEVFKKMNEYYKIGGYRFFTFSKSRMCGRSHFHATIVNTVKMDTIICSKGDRQLDTITYWRCESTNVCYFFWQTGDSA